VLFRKVVFQRLKRIEGLEASENRAGKILILFYSFNSYAVEDVVIELGFLHSFDL
jgi:hypothetical protein